MLKTNLKQINIERILINFYKDVVLSDQSTHFIYNFVYQQHTKNVNKNHPI